MPPDPEPGSAAIAVLVVDDDPAMRDMLAANLGPRGFDVTIRPSSADAIEQVEARDFDVVVADVKMAETDGVALCRQLTERRPNLPVILITGFGTMQTAIEAIRAGAYDFLPKPFRIDHLVMAIQRGATLSRLKQEIQRLRRAVAPRGFGELIGTSAAMVELFQLLDKVAASDAPVLIRGESGTGKELVARAIHNRGQRAAGPLVAINCAAVPPALLEAELFGHERGAFTDARTQKVGLFEAANGGTLFLDEVGELPLEVQPKLLRALQERVVRPLGSTAEIPFDARLVVATNRDLETMVDEGRFRQDLFFRINVIPVAIPPLRSRGGDVLVLARHFLESHATGASREIRAFSPEAAEKLMAYPWPGNVRELENCVEHAVALATFAQIAVGDLPEKIRTYRATELVVRSGDPSALVTLDELERRYTARVLEDVQGNKAAAARILGIERRTLYRMLERWKMS